MSNVFTRGVRHTPAVPVGSTISQLHFDGSNGSTVFTDTTSKTWTRAGNTVISTAKSYSGGASGYFDGSGDRIYTTHASVAVGTTDFSEEFMMFPTLFNSTYQRLVQIGSNSSAGGLWLIETANIPGSLMAQTHNGSVYLNVAGPTPSGIVPLNEWSHISFSRQSGVFYLAVRGVIKSVMNSSGVGNNITQTTLMLGSNTSNSESYKGFIDDFRMVSGTALRTYNRPPPGPYLVLP